MTDEKTEPIPPEHMDRWARNQRLYETLKGMGLFVSPIFDRGDATRIDHILVSVGPPLETATTETAERPETGIVTPVERTEVGNIIGPAHPLGGGKVIKFPTVF